MQPIMKKHYDQKQHYFLDKTKFLQKFAPYEGLQNHIDGKYSHDYVGLDLKTFNKLKKDKEKQAEGQSFNQNFYGNYTNEEILLSNAPCGGSANQPICNFDFTIRLLNHDHLNFSTRHLASKEGWATYINDRYFSLEKLDTCAYYRQA